MVFAACAFPVHTWTIVVLLREIPAWILRLNVWDLLGVSSYALVMAGLESCLLLGGLLLLAAILPAQWLLSRFVPLGSGLVFLAAAWMMVIQINDDVIRNMPVKSLVPWLLAGLLFTGILFFLTFRSKRVQAGLTAFVDRLLILAYLYVGLDILGIFIILLRNLRGAAWPV